MNQDAITRMKNQIPYLNPALRRIGEYILDHQEQCKTITIKDLAIACEVAESTVTRFVKENGFKNFQELKISLTEFTTSQVHADKQAVDVPIYEDIAQSDSTDDIIEKIFYKNIQKMTACRELLHIPSINQAVDLLSGCAHIIFVCTGSSAVAAEEAVMRFTRAGKNCSFWRDYSLQLMSAAILDENDVVIGISDSGKTKSVIEVMTIARASGAKLIAITSDSSSPLAAISDVVLLSPDRISKSPSALHWESTSSKAAQILIIDILYACFAVRNYDSTLTHLDHTYKAIRRTRKE